MSAGHCEQLNALRPQSLSMPTLMQLHPDALDQNKHAHYLWRLQLLLTEALACLLPSAFGHLQSEASALL